MPLVSSIVRFVTIFARLLGISWWVYIVSYMQFTLCTDARMLYFIEAYSDLHAVDLCYREISLVATYYMCVLCK